MIVPRLEIRLDHLQHNAATLVERLRRRNIAVTGVTKATLGHPEVARALLRGGVRALGESRIENVERLRAAGIEAPVVLVRSPMASQADRVVAAADVSLNTEFDVLARLSDAARAQGRSHGVVLMVELGDLREGIPAGQLLAMAGRLAALPHLVLSGIGTNLACQNGVAPDRRNMAELSRLTERVERLIGRSLAVVSGGNSANLHWVEHGAEVGRINDLRLGEAILLGCEPLHRRPLAGLHHDAFTLVAEVIEANRKPLEAWGTRHQNAFGTTSAPAEPTATAGTAPTTSPECTAADSLAHRVIVALGRQDVDPEGLHLPDGWSVLGASSDHLVLDPGTDRPAVGAEVRFGVDYGALLRAMTSPFIAQVHQGGQTAAADAAPSPG